jgi:hypothetical protein
MSFKDACKLIKDIRKECEIMVQKEKNKWTRLSAKTSFRNGKLLFKPHATPKLRNTILFSIHCHIFFIGKNGC